MKHCDNRAIIPLIDVLFICVYNLHPDLLSPCADDHVRLLRILRVDANHFSELDMVTQHVTMRCLLTDIAVFNDIYTPSYIYTKYLCFQIFYSTFF